MIAPTKVPSGDPHVLLPTNPSASTPIASGAAASRDTDRLAPGCNSSLTRETMKVVKAYAPEDEALHSCEHVWCGEEREEMHTDDNAVHAPCAVAWGWWHKTIREMVLDP